MWNCGRSREASQQPGWFQIFWQASGIVRFWRIWKAWNDMFNGKSTAPQQVFEKVKLNVWFWLKEEILHHTSLVLRNVIHKAVSDFWLVRPYSLCNWEHICFSLC